MPAPPIDLSSTTFGTIVNVALNTSGNFLNFDPANDDIAFLMSVFVYEDVGVTACACCGARMRLRCCGFCFVLRRRRFIC